MLLLYQIDGESQNILLPKYTKSMGPVYTQRQNLTIHPSSEHIHTHTHTIRQWPPYVHCDNQTEYSPQFHPQWRPPPPPRSVLVTTGHSHTHIPLHPPSALVTTHTHTYTSVPQQPTLVPALPKNPTDSYMFSCAAENFRNFLKNDGLPLIFFAMTS